MVATTPLPNTSTDTGPLDWRIAITDSGGRPTPEFQRRWNTQRNNNGLIGTTVGHGVPTDIPSEDGLSYINEDTNPATAYVSINGEWVQVSSNKFTQLLDTPHSYTTFSGETLRVNSGATGLEFATVSALLDGIGNVQGDILYRDASGWHALTPGTPGNVLTTGGSGTNPTWATPSSGTGTVSSVALTAPSIFSVSGSPITTSGTLALSLATQSPNVIFAGPSSGGVATPTFRALASNDLPIATTGAFGAVKPDGTTITISGGVISSAGSGGGVTSYFGTGAPSTLHNDGDLYFDNTATPYTAYVQSPDGGGTGTGNPVVRGTTSIDANVNPAVIPFPAAAVAGDEAFIFIGGGWSVPSAPSGWTQLDNQAGSNFNGFVAQKTLNSGDISAGSVSVAMAGTFNLFGACIVIEGGTLGSVRSVTFNRNGGSGATDTVTTPSGVLTSDLGVYFGAQRGSTLVTVNQGTQLEQQTDGSSASGVLSAGNIASAGTVTAVFTYPTASQSGFYDGILILEGTGSGPIPGWVNVSVPSYAEGTFTPGLTLGGASTGITYSGQSGSYVKIGSLVTLNWRVALTSKGTSTGNIAVTGLPFTPSVNTIGNALVNGGTSLPVQSATLITSGSTSSRYISNNGTGLIDLTDANMTNTTVLTGSSIFSV